MVSEGSNHKTGAQSSGMNSCAANNETSDSAPLEHKIGTLYGNRNHNRGTGRIPSTVNHESATAWGEENMRQWRVLQRRQGIPHSFRR